MKTKRNPSTIHPPLSTYSHQIELDRESRLLTISGQIGAKSNGDIAEDVSEQIKLAWHNVGENLLAANMSYKDVVKLTVYLVHECIDMAERRRLFEEIFSAVTPCMTMLYVSALGDPSMKVELDVWASSSD